MNLQDTLANMDEVVDILKAVEHYERGLLNAQATFNHAPQQTPEVHKQYMDEVKFIRESFTKNMERILEYTV
jgi:hypothetical protein